MADAHIFAMAPAAAQAEPCVSWVAMKQQVRVQLAERIVWVDAEVEGGAHWPVQQWLDGAARRYVYDLVQARAGILHRPADLPAFFHGVAEAVLYMLPPHLRHDLLERPCDADAESASVMWLRYLEFAQLLATNAANWALLRFDHALYGARRQIADRLDYCQGSLQFHLNRGGGGVFEADASPALLDLVTW